jgi:hypothetical protein
MADHRPAEISGLATNTSARWRIQRAGDEIMLWTIFVILLILWLLGFSFHVAGSLVHLLLVIALIVLIFNLISGRRAAI